jgi:DNA/RNA-binding domain of Phe-tRNA-synthetase-like protein
VSVLHQVPVGGEDLSRYVGAPRLLRAFGDERFDTITDGADAVEHPDPGEVVRCDEAGVTCQGAGTGGRPPHPAASRHHHSPVHL